MAIRWSVTTLVVLSAVLVFSVSWAEEPTFPWHNCTSREFSLCVTPLFNSSELRCVDPAITNNCTAQSVNQSRLCNRGFWTASLTCLFNVPCYPANMVSSPSKTCLSIFRTVCDVPFSDWFCESAMNHAFPSPRPALTPAPVSSAAAAVPHIATSVLAAALLWMRLQ